MPKKKISAREFWLGFDTKKGWRVEADLVSGKFRRFKIKKEKLT